MRIFTIIAIAFLLAAPAAAADWTVGPAPSDDPSMLAATVGNEDGHVLYLWARHADGRYQVFAELHLGRGEAFAGTPPTYRIDDGKTIDTKDIRDQGEELGALWAHVGKDAAFWLVWTSIQTTILPSDVLHDWFAGKEIQITYQAADGTSKTTTFPLAGSAAAVHDAAGLDTQQ
jgi:hypothetical protein